MMLLNLKDSLVRPNAPQEGLGDAPIYDQRLWNYTYGSQGHDAELEDSQP